MNPHWSEGIDEFNRRRYWHAHECWEQGWKELPPREKTYLQGLIQVAAVFHLLEKGRQRPALSLARTALLKLRDVPPGPRVAIPGASEALDALLQNPSSWVAIAQSLRAHLFEPAPEV